MSGTNGKLKILNEVALIKTQCRRSLPVVKFALAVNAITIGAKLMADRFLSFDQLLAEDIGGLQGGKAFALESETG